MTDLKTRLGGLELRNPFILASGPLSYDGEAILRAHQAGAGAVVTKTISRVPASNPIPHIAKVNEGLLNGEKWSDLPYERWIEHEVPLAKEGGATVIASLGLTPDDVAALARPIAKAGADALEVVSYDGAALVPMVRETAQEVEIPILAKVSSNWPDAIEVASLCLKNGAVGITAIDSLGPALRLDIERRAPVLGSGYGWLTGRAIFPIALRVVSEIALATGSPIVGTGGIGGVDDCLEMFLAGAHAVGLCTLPMLRGISVFADLAEGLSTRLHELGYQNLEETIGTALLSLREYGQAAEGVGLPTRGKEETVGASFVWEEGRCTDCGLCVRICPYSARTSPEEVDLSRCRFCGLCASACPMGALALRVGRGSR
jgi:dihydroorotate dehydrogenase (fumarate)